MKHYKQLLLRLFAENGWELEEPTDGEEWWLEEAWKIRSTPALLLLLTLLAGIACAADTNESIVRKIVAEQLGVHESAVGLDTPLNAVGPGADALDVIEIFMALDETLHADISDANVEAVIGPNKTDELPAKTTVRKLAKMVAIAKRK